MYEHVFTRSDGSKVTMSVTPSSKGSDELRTVREVYLNSVHMGSIITYNDDGDYGGFFRTPAIESVRTGNYDSAKSTDIYRQEDASSHEEVVQKIRSQFIYELENAKNK